MGIKILLPDNVTCMLFLFLGIATIGELSEILQLDYDYVRELYQVSVAMINAAPDGVENYMKSWQVTILLADFFRNAQYPNWPLGVTMVDSFYMTWGLIRVYGPEFLQTFQPWEKMHVDAYKFITALTGKYISIEEKTVERETEKKERNPERNWMINE